MTRSFTLIMMLMVVFQTTTHAGGPWPKKKKEGYAQLGFTYIGYNKFFNHEGKVVSLRRPVTDFTTQLFLDYGITDRLTLTANLPFKYVATADKISSSDSTYFQDTIQSGNLFGLSNVMLGLKYNIIKKKVLFSVGMNFEANVAKYDSLTTLRTGPESWVFNPYLSVGTTFYKHKFYTFLDLGWRTRTNNYYHEADFNFELGFTWNQKTYFIASLSGRIPVTVMPVQDELFRFGDQPRDNNITASHPNGRDLHTSLYPNNQQYVGYGLKFIQKIKKVHINAAVYFGTGNMVAAAPSYNLGVAYEW